MEQWTPARVVFFIFFGISVGSMILSGLFKLADGDHFNGVLQSVFGLLLIAIGVKIFRSDFLRS